MITFSCKPMIPKFQFLLHLCECPSPRLLLPIRFYWENRISCSRRRSRNRRLLLIFPMVPAWSCIGHFWPRRLPLYSANVCQLAALSTRSDSDVSERSMRPRGPDLHPWWTCSLTTLNAPPQMWPTNSEFSCAHLNFSSSWSKGPKMLFKTIISNRHWALRDHNLSIWTGGGGRFCPFVYKIFMQVCSKFALNFDPASQWSYRVPFVICPRRYKFFQNSRR